MHRPDAQGGTLAQHLNAVEAIRPSHWERDPRLDGVQFGVPEDFRLYGFGLLAHYEELTAGRQTGFNGVEAFTWSDIHSWVSLNEYEFTPYEIQTIKAMDIAFVNTVRRLQNER